MSTAIAPRISATTIITLAEQDVGQAEDAGRPNRSAWLDPIQERVSVAHGWVAAFLVGQPWCGTWLYDVLRRAGVQHQDNPAHPSTEVMWTRASAAGILTATPVPGALIVWRGVHTGLVVAVGDEVVHTIEGNSGDMVARRVRARNGTHRYIVPPWLAQTAPTVTEHWLEDLQARPRVLGPWKVKAWAERSLASLPPARRRVSTLVQPGVGGWAIREGAPRNYGPWATDAMRRKAQATLETRLGRRLRAYNRTRRATASVIGGQAESLGRTQ